MKNRLFIIIAALFLCGSASSQTKEQTIKLMDLVVEVPKSDLNKTWTQLKDKLNSMVNVRVEGYCAGQKLLYLRLDPAQYFNVLVAIDEAGFTYYVKKDFNVNKGIETCKDREGLYLRESSSVN